MTSRVDDLVRFYAILDALERTIGGRRLLSECSGKMDWPQRGVYFFMEEGERRSDRTNWHYECARDLVAGRLRQAASHLA